MLSLNLLVNSRQTQNIEPKPEYCLGLLSRSSFSVATYRISSFYWYNFFCQNEKNKFIHILLRAPTKKKPQIICTCRRIKYKEDTLYVHSWFDWHYGYEPTSPDDLVTDYTCQSLLKVKITS